MLYAAQILRGGRAQCKKSLPIPPNEHVEDGRASESNAWCSPEHTFKRRLLQKSEGNFSNKFPGEFAGDLWVDFWGLFLGKKTEGYNPPKKSTAKLKSEFGSYADKIHTARICL